MEIGLENLYVDIGLIKFLQGALPIIIYRWFLQAREQSRM